MKRYGDKSLSIAKVRLCVFCLLDHLISLNCATSALRPVVEKAGRSGAMDVIDGEKDINMMSHTNE